MTRNLSRRLERLEDQLTPPGEPLVIEVQFIAAGTMEVIDRLSVPVGGHSKRSGQAETSFPAKRTGER